MIDVGQADSLSHWSDSFLGQSVMSITVWLGKLGNQIRLGMHRVGAWFGTNQRPTSKDDTLGRRGERAAAAYLQELGYQIVCCSYQTVDGELDLVAIDQEVIVYVEVKTLKRPGSRPEAAVNRKKRLQIIKLAKSFAASRGLLHHRSRFDVVAVVWPDPDSPPLIRHHKSAFRGDERTPGVYSREH